VGGGNFRVFKDCFRGRPHGTGAAHSLAVTFVGLFALEVLDCAISFAENRVSREISTEKITIKEEGRIRKIIDDFV
jgi:hypothetical protein